MSQTSLYNKLRKILVKNSLKLVHLKFFCIPILDMSIVFFSKILIEFKTSNNRSQTVVKVSMKIGPKIFNLQQKLSGCKLVEIVLQYSGSNNA